MIPRIEISGAWTRIGVLVLFLVAWGADARGSDQGDRSPADLIQGISIDSLSQHIRRLENAGGHRSRVTFTPGNDSAALYIKRRFDALPGLTSVTFDTFFVTAQAPYNTKPLTNIIATMQGTAQPSRVFVLGAHFDGSASRMGTTTWNQQWSTIAQPGADDNATGVAAILEIARVLSDPASGFPRDMTVRFIAFASEESGPAHSGGHGGSRHFAETARAHNENIIGMISIDMIGYNRLYYYQDIVADSNSQWLGKRFRAALDSSSILLTTNSPPYPYATYSDHASFWEQNYPAILLIEGAPPWNSSAYYTANPYYHTSSDSAGTVNLELVRKVAQGALAVTVSLAGVTTGVDEGPPEIPASVELYQNYPNPFNPTTVISYQTPIAGKIKLSVFDLLGQEVAVLVDEVQFAGRHTVTFNGGALASGVYLYRLQAGNLTRSRRLLLVR
jgi:hypothetical protein